MALFKLLLKGFEFPADLPAKNSNFRFIFQLRHFDATSETWVTTESVAPGLSTYWECDQSKEDDDSNDAKYVRDGANPRFRALSPWDQVVLLVSSTELFQMRVVVYDVNRKDWVDQLRKLGEGLLGALVGAAKNLPIPSQAAATVGTLLQKLREALVDSMAREDTVLFAITYQFGSNQSSQPIDLSHPRGYTMRLELVTTGRPEPSERAAMERAGAAPATGRIDTETAFARVPKPAARQTTKPRSAKQRASKSRR